MQNRWFSGSRASARNLPFLTAGEGLPPPPLVPPDPPDPSASLSIAQFPPLTPPVTQAKGSTLRTVPPKAPVVKRSNASTPTTDVVKTQSNQAAPAGAKTGPEIPRSENTVQNFTATIHTVANKKMSSPVDENVTTDVPMPQVEGENHPNPSVTVPKTLTSHENLITLPPKKPSPIQTNKATSNSIPTPTETRSTISSSQKPEPQPSNKQTGAQAEKATPTLAEKLRHFAEKSLTRLTPVAYSEKGTPKVLIPYEVFQEGA
ncbi:unnamed protein product [Microthlaspi erraticum]|uniref:Uncharacterized protein n=1 Tax=Microthlaspi erraticum TaxID=1685480 RepID=A0A6D2L5S5_9BRAS|nr:unnamed protein product [Microthlaspi erraticum]